MGRDCPVDAEKLPVHVALLTGFIPPYQAPVYRALAQRLQRLTILVSTPMESDRKWEADWRGLDVRVQKTWTVTKQQRRKGEFNESGEMHLPLDTWKQIRSLNPDVVISEELGFRSLMCVAHTRLIRRCRQILVCNVSEHTESGRGVFRRLIRRLLVRNCDAITADGNSGQRYLQSLGVPSERLFRFPHAALSEQFLKLPLDRPDEDITKMVCCGFLKELKGVRQMFDALERSAKNNPSQSIVLTLIGDGPLRRELETRPRTPNFTAKFLGQLPYDQIAATYADQSIFIFPTLADEWGLVVNEALAAGLPVLGSVFSQAVDDLVVERNNGWRFTPTEPESFDAAIARCISTDSSQLREMRHAARKSISPRTPEWAAEQMLEAIASVMK